ncbi:MAG: NAD(P)/FAD-dependent oxidoreductase [Bacteroidota bacterium]|nr:NAD(P)/FAD-dependent oxidoreductase [Bacteroidota bacterium]
MQNQQYDSIIIGSGAGGLTTALCLSRAGQRVLVLEQHDVPGGWCHSFQINGHRFSPGVHYIGLVEKGQSTSLLYEGLGVANDMVFFRMNSNAYEHCVIGNERIDLPAGIDNLMTVLSARFPHEKKNIKDYVEMVARVGYQLQLIPRMKGFWDHLTIAYRTRHMGKYGLFSLKRVINWYIKDPLLKAVLNVQCGDHGLPPDKASFPVHCAVMGHYFNGACYPMGGGGGIVKAFTTSIKKYGGEIRTQQQVKKIIIDKNKAVGVELADGGKIYATRIISNADPGITYLQLVGEDSISKKLAKKLAATKYSVTSLILFLTLEMDVRAAGMDSGNVWQLEHPDLDTIYNNLTHNNVLEGDEFPAVFISCTTLKDPVSYNGRHHNFEVVTFIGYDCFKEFNSGNDYHNEAYAKFKNRIMEKMMNNLEKILPGAKNHVVQMELGTPKTNQFYINSTRGNVYGTEKTFNQVGPFSFGSKSEIENLFLCGASTLSHGVGGASHSGIATAATILGCRPDELLRTDPEQNIRIYDAEDPSSWPDWVHQKITDKKRRNSNSGIEESV